MPATFAHCMLCQESIGLLLRDERVRKSPALRELAGLVAQRTEFAITGAAGPDYPYLNDLLTTGVLHVGHTWADRMHYENVDLFIEEAVKRLIAMDKESEALKVCLPWTLGCLSHVIADVFLHPVVNAIVGGTYHFTSAAHAYCELVQDLYIFHHKTGVEIIDANPKSGKFAYLSILDASSDPDNEDRLHPAISTFWRETLIAAHPQATEYFNDIAPDIWHRKYKARVDFAVNPWPVARHIMQAADRAYGRLSKIPKKDMERFVEAITLPDETTGKYSDQFEKAVNQIVALWITTLRSVAEKRPVIIQEELKAWNLDTGVDESKSHFWAEIRRTI